MQIVLIILVVLHVLSGVFWAGSTFALARLGGRFAEHLVKPQLHAAAGTVVTGVALWGIAHRGFAGRELVLSAGAILAIVAAGIQSGVTLPAVKRLATSEQNETLALYSRITVSQRIAALCLLVTVASMAASRYV